MTTSNMQDIMAEAARRMDELGNLLQYAIYCEAIHRDGVKPIGFEEWAGLRKAMTE